MKHPRVIGGKHPGLRPLLLRLAQQSGTARRTNFTADLAVLDPQPSAVISEAQKIERGRRVIGIELEALQATSAALDHRFAQAVDRICEVVRSDHKLLLSGVGKNAPIAQKLAATFNSIGAPSCFLDPTQAVHGDLGLCSEGDLALLFSNSGQSEEVMRLLPLLHRFGVGCIGVTSREDSPLAKETDLCLLYVVPREACPLQVAPTASTTATLALGDALAMAVMEELGLTRDVFARYHPGGALGRSLLLRARDLMRTGERFAREPQGIAVQAAILAMTRAKSGCLALTDADGRLAGLFTDGDFRRAAAAHPDLLSQPVANHMTRTPVTIRATALVSDASRIFEERKIDDLVVVDEGNRPIGIIDLQDLPKVKII